MMLEVARPKSGSSSTWFLVELEFGNGGFWGEGKTGVSTRRKTSRRKERTNNKLNPDMALMPEFEPGQHWWEASAALTTALSVETLNWCGMDMNQSCLRERTIDLAHLFWTSRISFWLTVVPVLEQIENKFAPESKMLTIKMDYVISWHCFL